MNRFTYKVVVEIDDAANKVLECYGEAKSRKKDAEHDAAEGVLWYLKCEGYLWHQN